MAVALIVAAGRGERLAAGTPKALVALGGRPMLAWSLRAVRAVEAVRAVVVALPPEAPPLDELLSGGELNARPLYELIGGGEPGAAAAPVRAVAGGAARSHSVAAALAAAPPGDDAVLVHDAARPLAAPELFTRTLAALGDGVDAAIAAAPLADTVKEAGTDGVVRRTLDRSTLWAVQTPQAFRRAALAAALDQSDEVLASATDDAWLIERAGGVVRVVESPRPNLKVTTPADLRLAELLLSEAC